MIFLSKHQTIASQCPLIAHVQYIKIITWPRGLRDTLQIFHNLSLAIPRRDLSTKKIKPNIEKWPDSLGVMLEFQYIERGLFLMLKAIFIEPAI